MDVSGWKINAFKMNKEQNMKENFTPSLWHWNSSFHNIFLHTVHIIIHYVCEYIYHIHLWAWCWHLLVCAVNAWYDTPTLLHMVPLRFMACWSTRRNSSGPPWIQEQDENTDPQNTSRSDLHDAKLHPGKTLSHIPMFLWEGLCAGI